jgi:lysozyme family protein
MTAANWLNCFALTIGSEGGYGRNPKDRGDWTSGKIGVGELKGTKYGIAAFAYPGLDIKNLTLEDARAIYRRDYWPKVAGDTQPEGVDLNAWDICVNSGSARALRILAQALDSKLTTAMGLAQLAKLAPDKVAVIKRMCALRASFYRALSTFETFGKGWLSRNARMEANGVRMALNAAKLSPAEQKKRLEQESSAAATKAATHAKNAGGAIVGTGGTSAGATQSIDWSQVIGWSLLALACLAALLFFIHWYRNHKARADAYTAVASATGG